MEAAVQVQQVNVQQASGYYRTQAGVQGMEQVVGVQAQANPFGALLDQLLGGAQQSDEMDALLETLSGEMDETEQDAAMQLLAQLFAGQPALVQQIDPELLAQLTAQMPTTGSQPVQTMQQSAMTALLWQQPTETALQDTAAQTAFTTTLAQQTGLEIVQTVPGAQNSEAQNAMLFEQAGYQRALYEAQQQIAGDGKTQSAAQEQTTETAQPVEGKQTKQTADTPALIPMADNTRVFTTASTGVQQTKEADVQNLLAQVKTGLLDGARKGEDNFVIKLKPEGLGEITVRMAQQDGKISMDILASNQQTQRLLSSEISSLRQAMEPYNVVVNSQQADGGSTSFSLEQQMRQGFAQQQQNQQNTGTYYFAQDELAEEAQSAYPWSADLASGLDVYT